MKPQLVINSTTGLQHVLQGASGACYFYSWTDLWTRIETDKHTPFCIPGPITCSMQCIVGPILCADLLLKDCSPELSGHIWKTTG